MARAGATMGINVPSIRPRRGSSSERAVPISPHVPPVQWRQTPLSPQRHPTPAPKLPRPPRHRHRQRHRRILIRPRRDGQTRQRSPSSLALCDRKPFLTTDRRRRRPRGPFLEPLGPLLVSAPRVAHVLERARLLGPLRGRRPVCVPSQRCVSTWKLYWAT